MYELKLAPEETNITPIKLFLKGFLDHKAVKVGASRAASARLPFWLRLSVCSLDKPVIVSMLF